MDRGTATVVQIKRILLAIFATCSIHATVFFIPPKGWEIADPSQLAPSVHICFLGKSSKGLAPSVNLATEPVDISLDAYVEEVRKIHVADPNSRWRDLGRFRSLLGDGRLMEIEIPSEFGTARMVQLVVIKDKTAYILTTGALKEEFSKFYKTFDPVLRSLQETTNLTQAYPLKSADLKALIDNLSQNIKSENFEKDVWQPFEKKIINDFTEMGPYWQILILNELHTKMLTLRSSNE